MQENNEGPRVMIEGVPVQRVGGTSSPEKSREMPVGEIGGTQLVREVDGTIPAQSFKGRLEVSGIGKTSGGIYDSVHIEGVGKIQGDLACNRCELEGVAEIDGDLKARTVSLTGTAKVRGSVRAEHVDIEGAAKVQGDVYTAEMLKLHGSLSVNGSVEAGTFHSDGVFAMSGHLKAKAVTIELQGRDSRTASVRAEKIRVTHGKGLRKHKFDVVVIEGNDIYLEGTIADLVRGDTVTIGPGCKVERVEYRVSCKEDKRALIRVKQQVQ